MTRTSAFPALLLSRLREFYREPEAIFWVYGFPVLLAVGLGIAFRARPPAALRVDAVVADRSAASPNPEGTAADPQAAAAALKALEGDPRFRARSCAGDECAQRLRLGRTDIVVVAGASGVEFRFDPTRPESVLA